MFYISLQIYARVANKRVSMLMSYFEKTISVCYVLMFSLQWATKYASFCN
jgi:hypothetical protein